jgi:AcrR family transcriptional regulator
VTEDKEPRSRRERPAKAALTRDGIVRTAVELIKAEGLRRVTMRRLADELDTGAASLYVYVRNTAELHAAVLDELLGSVELAPTVGDWQERLEAVLTSYGDVLLEYPELAQVALVARPSGPKYLDLIETLLALLDEGGVAKDRAAWGIDLLLQFVTASAAEHAGEKDPGEWDPLAKKLRVASPDVHPQLVAHGEDLLSGPGEARLAWGLRVLINGVRDTPRPEGTP